MNTLKSIKVRLYPTNTQINYLTNLFGCYRFTFNSCLNLKLNTYKTDKTNLGLKELGHYFHHDLIVNNQFLKEHNTKVLKQSIINLLDSYKRFFINHNGFPKFKSKYDKQSVRFPIDAISKNTFLNNKLNLTKTVKNLKFKCSDKDLSYLTENKELIKSITISKTKTDKYFASILIEFIPIDKPVNTNVIGIDVGLNSYYTDSNQVKITNPRYLRKSLDKLKDYQRINSKKVKNSKNYLKYKSKIANLHEKIVNQRTNFSQTITTNLINENQVIILENLDVKSMLENHQLALSISDASWSKFKRLISYKSIWYKRDLILIDKYYPSTKTCSSCKNKQDIKLDERVYICKTCGIQIDRDYNASLNIKNEGLRILSDNSLKHVSSRRLGCNNLI